MKCSPEPEVPAAVVAFTVTVPAVCEGEVTLIAVALTKVTEPLGIVVPPECDRGGPRDEAAAREGDRRAPGGGAGRRCDLGDGGGGLVGEVLTGPEVPPAVVAFTVTVAAACDGEVTLILWRSRRSPSRPGWWSPRM